MGAFDQDNPVIRTIGRIANAWLIGFLWLVTSLPVVTAGASTTAMIYAEMKLLNDTGKRDVGTPVSNFFRSFKENFRQATGIWLIYLAAGALITLNLYYWNNAQTESFVLELGIAYGLLIFYLISFVWVFAVQSKFVNTVMNTIRYSYAVAWRNMKETALMLITIGSVIVIAVETPGWVFLFFYLNFGVGLTVFMFSVFYTKVFRKYIPKELQDPDDDADPDVVGGADTAGAAEVRDIILTEADFAQGGGTAVSRQPGHGNEAMPGQSALPAGNEGKTENR